MRLLNVKFNEDINYSPFIDELDRFDEFDIDMISKDYDKKYETKNKIKNVDEVL